MKGDVYVSSITKKTDELTGTELIQLTDNSGDTYHPYFTKTLIDLNNEYMLLGSNRTGAWQLYTLRLRDGQMVQITESIGIQPFNSVLDAKHHKVYYFANRTLKCVRLDNLEEDELMEIPEGFKPSDMSITNEGDFLSFSYVEKIDLSTETTKIYSAMRETFFRKPTSVIIRFDVAKKMPFAVWGEHRWISHVNISPLDPNLILFCHEGPWHLVHRMWTARVDRDEVLPLIDQRPGLEKIGHEFFTASGRIGAQYSYRDRIGDEFYKHGDIFVNADGTGERRYYYPYTRPSHIQLNYEETLGVGDRAPIRKEMKDHGNYIALLKYEGESVQVGLLCKHETSWRTQVSHPHPIFTRDDQYVIFSSDRGGKANVYMARVDWDACVKSD
ncbi:Oligogalacturonate lyase [Paenibacillus sp. 1_12]|uniref:oligogalacturonate lyase family protein n=1 Tax=Paenibacillus sp. 1_12 TaxID=1566278 RepID=UPI0008EBF704|nr:oligogalacturonate lyase family protein [Paenibacillus sp. 1_12]SFL58433.1 Oligogalacturonate lyase [Paenibacillus sp. 1_12]